MKARKEFDYEQLIAELKQFNHHESAAAMEQLIKDCQSLEQLSKDCRYLAQLNFKEMEAAAERSMSVVLELRAMLKRLDPVHALQEL